MGRATLQGRHRGLGEIGIGKRTALESADFRGNVAETCVYPLSVGHDPAAITEVYGREYLGAIRALRPHRYHCFSSNAVKPGCNRKR